MEPVSIQAPSPHISSSIRGGSQSRAQSRIHAVDQRSSRSWTIAVGLILAPGITVAVPTLIFARLGLYGARRGIQLATKHIKHLSVPKSSENKVSSPHKLRKKRAKEIVWKTLIKDVKIACLMLIPAGGIFLASTYAKLGYVSVQDAVEHPSIAALTASIGNFFKGGPEKVIYNDAVRKVNYTKNAPKENQEELTDTNRFFGERSSGEFSFSGQPDSEQLASEQLGHRYFFNYDTVQTGNGRSHEILHLGSLPIDKSKPTVILYHGRGGCKEGLIDRAERYLQDGCNVVLSSFAGDGARHHPECAIIDCTEEEMLYDAQADIAYLASIGVKEVAVHGYSLGGAQAGNCLAFMAHKKENNVYEDKLITYNDKTFTAPKCTRMIFERTFTSAEEVAGNTIYNVVFDTLKTTSIFFKNLIADSVTVGYQHEHMMGVVDSVCGVKLDRLNTYQKLSQLSESGFCVDCTLLAAAADEVTGYVGEGQNYMPDYDMTVMLQQALHPKSRSLAYYFPDTKHVSPIQWKNKKINLLGTPEKPLQG